MPCKKILDIFVHASPQEIFDFLCSNAKLLNTYKIKFADTQNLAISLKGGINWDSWGENITIKIQRDTNETTKIIVSSESAVPTTLIDWGRNQKNVERIAEYIYSAFSIERRF